MKNVTYDLLTTRTRCAVVIFPRYYSVDPAHIASNIADRIRARSIVAAAALMIKSMW